VQYGHALKELGRPAEALYAYEMAMALEPQDAETLLHLAHLRSASGDISGALAAFDRVARSAARAELAGEARRVADGLRRDLGTGALIQLGDAANREQRWAEAAEAYAEALTQDRGLAHIWVQYGHCLKEQGHAEEAACAYHEALRHAPELEDAAKHLHALRGRLGYLAEG
jgi:tetratricopeptide (TPR) repeat protein